jgi:hypothetical protein
MKAPRFFTLLCVALAASLARAETLVQFDGTAVAPATIVSNALDSTNLTRMTLASPGGINWFNLNVSGRIQVTTSAWTNNEGTFGVETALVRDNYFYFTITAREGYTIELSSLAFDADGTRSDTERGFWIFSSVRDYAAENVLASDVTTTASFKKNYNVPLLSISGSTLTLHFGESVTFRFYVQTPSANSSIYFDNITVTGTATPVTPGIPEPGTAVMFYGTLVFVLSLLIRRRLVRA